MHALEDDPAFLGTSAPRRRGRLRGAGAETRTAARVPGPARRVITNARTARASTMLAHEQLIRDFYAARDRRDRAMVGELLAPHVRWHESGEEEHSGEHHGRETVIGLLQKFIEL